MNITQFQLEELIKCHKDPVYFIKKYILLDVELANKHVEHIVSMHNNPIAIGEFDRGDMKTTMDVSYALWRIMFNHDQRIMFITKNSNETDQIMKRVYEYLDKLPSFMEPKIKIRNKHELRFESGSGITAGSVTRVRGQKLHMIFIPEFASYTDHQQDDIICTMYGYFSTDNKLVITTTDVSYKDSPYGKLVLSIKCGRRKGNIVNCP
ncbi:MAG TPA: hypothetical protein VFM18_13815 [Methanosarcina sp.]|nr:hypothetical protein [Methanosarcina sp.]